MKNIVIIALSIFAVYLLWNNGSDPTTETKVTEIKKEVSTPEIKDSGIEYITDTIKLKPTKKQIDSIINILELKYTDSISVLNALAETRLKLIEASKTREYEKTYDTDLYTLTIKERIKGYLDSREFNLKLKPQTIQYTETHTETILKPKFSLYYGFGANTNMSINANVGFENSKGNYFGVGYDTQQNILLSYRKRFYTKY